MPDAGQTNADFKFDRVSVKMFMTLGLNYQGARVFDASMTVGSHTCTSPTANFSTEDVGKLMYVVGAGISGASLITTIASFTSSTTVSLTAAAGTSVSGVEARWGLDCLPAFTAAIGRLAAGGQLFVPAGFYLTSDTIQLTSGVRLEGAAYTAVSAVEQLSEPQSFIVCVKNVPVVTISGAPCFSPAVAKLGLTGTPYSGSMGIFGAAVWDLTVEDCFFDTFGDNAILVQSTAPHFSVTGTFRHNFVQNSMLVKTGRTAYVGAVDIGCTDANVYDNNFNASFDYNAGGIVTGFIAAMAIRSPNCFVRHNQCSHGEVGVYVSADCVYGQITDVRGDLNQGHGWVINSGTSQFLGCRAHADSISANGASNGFLITGAGNRFIGCRVSYNGAGPGATFNQMLHAFETTITSAQESNHFAHCYVEPTSITGLDYQFTGSQKQQVVVEQTNLTIPGRPTERVRGDLLVETNPATGNSIFWIRDTNAGTDAKLWAVRVNEPSNINQLLYSVMSDNLSAEGVYFTITRSGATITEIDIQAALTTMSGAASVNGLLQVNGNIELLGTTAILACGSGSPNTHVTAVGGSLYLDGTGAMWIKTSGTGNTGWTQASTSSGGLNQLTGDVTAGPGTGSQAATVVQLQGRPFANTAPTDGQVITWDAGGSTWKPKSISGLNPSASAKASTTLTLTTSYQDIPSVTLTIVTAGTYLIMGVAECVPAFADGATFVQLLANGVAQSAKMLVSSPVAGSAGHYMASQNWIYTAGAGDVVKLQAKMNTAGGGGSFTDANSTIAFIKLA